MKRETWIALLAAIGFPLLMCGGCGIVTLAMRPGHDANVFWWVAVVVVGLLAYVPFFLRGVEKRKRRRK